MKIETGKKTLILHGMKTSAVLNAVLSDIYHLKKESAVKFSRRNKDVCPFENGGETSLEFFSHQTDYSLFVVSSKTHSAFHCFICVCCAMFMFGLLKLVIIWLV